jgi:diguanylate cyclase (GGDEF)-like protein/PAS domain S-box-containing protein
MISHATAVIDSTALDTAAEADRLAALRNLQLLDTPPSEAFDRITRLAAAALDVPIALVSLVDETRQWFKSRFGLDLQQTPRGASICAHAVAARRPLLVPDTAQDARFRASPFVLGPPHARSYVGVPIFTRLGHAIGTVCAIDRQPRNFDSGDIEVLNDCARTLEDVIHAQELTRHADVVLQFAGERDKLFRDTFELSGVGMVHVSLAGKLLRVNRHVCDMLGHEPGGLDQVSVVDLTHPEDIAASTDAFRRLSGGIADEYRIEKRLRRCDGAYRWCHLSVALKRAANGEPEYLIAVIQDVSDSRRVQQELSQARAALETQLHDQELKLQQSNDALREQAKNLLQSDLARHDVEHRLRAVADNIPALIGYWNRDLRCEFANEAYRGTFAIDPARIIGMQMRDLLGYRFEVAEPHARAALEGLPQRFETSSVKPDGSRTYSDVRYVPDRDADEVRGFFVLVTDITSDRNVRLALEAANSRLSNDSATDYLTGLSNRRSFHEHGEEAARRFTRNGELFGLVLLDLDGLQSINDGGGHDLGDHVLRSVGNLLKRQLRSHRDVASRLSGEEFAMLCFGALDEELLCQAAEHVRAQLKHIEIRCGTQDFSITGSFGLSISRLADEEWKGVYARAHTALRAAKSAGRDCVKFA